MNTIQTLGLIGGIIGIISFIGMLAFAAFYESLTSFLGQSNQDGNSQQLYIQSGVGIPVSSIGLVMPFALRRG